MSQFNILPKTVKQAMENGDYFVYRIYNRGGGKVRVHFKPRYHDCGKFLQFWIDRRYFSRVYPITYSRFG